MENIRDSSLDELYGTSRLNEPHIPGQINWKQVAVQTGIVILVIGITAAIVHNSGQQTLFALSKEYEAQLDSLKKQQELRNKQIVEELFNSRKDAEPIQPEKIEA